MRVIARAISEGQVSFSRHARERMAERNLIENDVVNVLRCGLINEEPEQRGKTWRYKVETGRMSVIVGLRSTTEVTVVSAWRET